MLRTHRIQQNKLSIKMFFIPKKSSVCFSSTCFFGCDCQNVAGVARAQAVGSKHAEVVGLGWTQIHQSQLGQLRVQDLSDDCSVPGG